MKEKIIFLQCRHCGEINKIDINLPVQVCIKCGEKIVIPQKEKKITVNG
jgi:DNA-directed RNA polymerase subunit RPC12/RpoP